LFEATLPIADRIVLTEVDFEPAGDTFFTVDRTVWREVSHEDVAAASNDDADFVVRVLER
jgi:hypothetical protein